MSSFKIGNITLEIDGFAYDPGIYNGPMPTITGPSPKIRVSDKKKLLLQHKKCGQKLNHRIYGGISLGMNIQFVPDKHRAKGLQFPGIQVPFSPFPETSPSIPKTPIYRKARIRKENEFVKASGLTKDEIRKKMDELYPRWNPKPEKKFINNYVNDYEFKLSVHVTRFVAIGSAKGPGFDCYFELTYPKEVSWIISDIKPCFVNGFDGVVEDPMKGEFGYQNTSEVDLQKKKPKRVKELETGEEKFRKKMRKYFEGKDIIDDLRERFKKK